MKFFTFKQGQFKDITINIDKILYIEDSPAQITVTLINYISFEITREELNRLYEIL